MIQFKRGSTKSWRDSNVKLASGQPGYDKDKHKLKIGDGKTSWASLPYASGLSMQEILDSESSAKVRKKQDSEDTTLITYGKEAPGKDTVGQVYLQRYEAEPEVDYIVRSGIDGIWTYQQYKSGIAKCWGTLKVVTSVQTAVEGSNLFQDSNKMKSVEYPFTFKNVPTEITTLQSPGGVSWLANKTKNTEKASGVYTILSIDKQLTTAEYSISIIVEGFWK